MRKTISLIAFLVITSIIIAKPNTLIFKAQIIGGEIIPLTKNLTNINPNPTLGGELAIEIPSWDEYSWQQYLGNPTLGIGFIGLDLGNSKILGQAFALYPYLLIDIIRTPHFELDWKIGAGMSFFNKTYNRVFDEFGNNPEWSYYGPTCNNLIGSIVNVYLTTGAHFNFPIKNGWAVHTNLGYIHMSNGSVLQPNGGINILYATIGTSYKLEQEKIPNTNNTTQKFSNLPYKWSLNITASGGYRELFYMDDKGYSVGSLHIGTTYNICNWYALGGSLDAFYDGVFNQQGAGYKEHTSFSRYIILNDDISNKFRIAASINNEFRIGRITAILDWGIYLYDPIRLAYTDANGNKYTKRPLLYKYNIEKEDGWNYFRLGVRCRVWNNLYVQTAVKTHLTKAEMIEWGIGYQIPFKQKQKKLKIEKNQLYETNKREKHDIRHSCRNRSH